MKKIISILSILIMISFIGGYSKTYNTSIEKIYNYEDVKNSLIRFHVLANSDSKEDQTLKLKVKDKVISYLYPYLRNSKSLDESRKLLIEQENNVLEIANKVIKENGYNYGVKTELGYENFPEKSYGNITLPQGKYEAFRIIIGNGKGHNWWCVMFPPLCFTDVTKGQVEEEKCKEEFDKAIEEKETVLNKEEGKEENNKVSNDNNKNNDNDLNFENNSYEKECNYKSEAKEENKFKYIEKDKNTNTEDECSDEIKIKLKVVEIFKDIFND
ncbi:MAG: stage II sporulation protein R [Clostridium sp.]|nr:stage II sporulation protein R [Clostridium sp.]